MGKNTNTVNGTSPYPTLKRPATADHLKRKPKQWQILEICQDLEAAQALADAEKALGEAELAIPSNVTGSERESRAAERRAAVDRCKKAVEEAQQAVDESSVQILLVGVDRETRRAIEDAHPPTEADITSARNNGLPVPDYDQEKVARAMIAATIHEPNMTEDEVADAISSWSSGEYMRLWMSVLSVNGNPSLVSPGKANFGTSGSRGTAGSRKS